MNTTRSVLAATWVCFTLGCGGPRGSGHSEDGGALPQDAGAALDAQSTLCGPAGYKSCPHDPPTTQGNFVSCTTCLVALEALDACWRAHGYMAQKTCAADGTSVEGALPSVDVLTQCHAEGAAVTACLAATVPDAGPGTACGRADEPCCGASDGTSASWRCNPGYYCELTSVVTGGTCHVTPTP